MGVALGHTLFRSTRRPDLPKGVEQTVTGYLRWVPPRIDTDMPHPARMHDYWLGGGHNFAADRELAEKIMRIMPGVEDVARLNQAFIRRAALFMVDQGIRQFLDIGSGIPTVGHLHEIVQHKVPECRVVYVDYDPVAVAHVELMLANTKGTAIVQAGMRDVCAIFDAEATKDLLDLTQPIGLLAPMLHFVPDSWDPTRIMADYRDRLAPGSFMALAHVTADADNPELPEVIEAYQATKFLVYPRTYEQIMLMCTGLDLVEPGLVGYAHWRAEDPGDLSVNPRVNSLLYGAVGRKP